MAIINTLLTAKDKMSDVLNNVADNANKAKKKINDSLGETSDKVESLEEIFNSLRGTSVTSFGDIIDLSNRVKTAMGAAEGGAMRWATTFSLVAGGVTAAGAAILSMIASNADYVRSLRQTADASNSSIEFLQQMKQEFRDTGFEIDKFGDINKDVLDHLGDAFRDGSGPADDMKALGLNVQEYNKFINQADGGTRALIHTYYELRNSGKNLAEITNMMETLASDGSHLVGTLKDFGSEADALNAILGQHAGISEETAEKYKEWDAQIDTLSTNFNNWKVNILAPTVEEINQLLMLMNGDWSNTEFAKFFTADGFKDAVRQFFTGGNNGDLIRDGMIKLGIDPVISYDGLDHLKGMVADLKGDMAGVNGAVKEGTGWKKPEKDNSAQKQKQFEAQQKQARDWLAQLDMNISTEQNKADANYQIQLKKLDDFHKRKLISEREYQRGVEMLNTQLYGANIEQIYQNQMERLNSQHEQMLISEQDYQTRLHQIQAERAGGILDMNRNNELEKLEFEHDQKLVSEENYQAKRLAIQQDYEQRRKDLTQATENIGRNDMFAKQAEQMGKYNETVNRGIDLAQGFASVITAAAEQGSAAWIVATIASKAMMVGQAIMAANLAAVQAAASTPGGPAAQMAAAESIQAWGYAQAAMIAAQGIVEIAGARAKGGPVEGGKTYLVGEKGPELFTVPGTGGQITSNANLQKAMGGGSGGGGNSEFHQTNIFQGSGVTADDMDTLKSMTESIVDKKLSDDKRKNGG